MSSTSSHHPSSATFNKEDFDEGIPIHCLGVILSRQMNVPVMVDMSWNNESLVPTIRTLKNKEDLISKIGELLDEVHVHNTNKEELITDDLVVGTIDEPSSDHPMKVLKYSVSYNCNEHYKYVWFFFDLNLMTEDEIKVLSDKHELSAERRDIASAAGIEDLIDIVKEGLDGLSCLSKKYDLDTIEKEFVQSFGQETS